MKVLKCEGNCKRELAFLNIHKVDDKLYCEVCYKNFTRVKTQYEQSM